MIRNLIVAILTGVIVYVILFFLWPYAETALGISWPWLPQAAGIVAGVVEFFGIRL